MEDVGEVVPNVLEPLTPEEYDALPVSSVKVPHTPRFNIHELLASVRHLKRQHQSEWLKEWISNLPEDIAKSLLHKWEFWARPNQIAPLGNWTYWILLAGRGFGKTRTGAEWINEKVQSGKSKRIALVAPTAADVRKTMVEGESGILAISPPWNRPIFEPSKLQLTWPNGTIAQLFSAEEPERLRGPQFDTFWADELAAWQKCQDTWDMLQFGFRLGRNPQGCITTTPKPIPIVRELLRDHLSEHNLPPEAKSIALTKGSTYDNRGNLAKQFFNKVVQRYEGTRLGRQELDGEVLEDMPGALWNRTSIDSNRIKILSPPFPPVIKPEDFLNSGGDRIEDVLMLRRIARQITEAVPEDISRCVVSVDPNVSNEEGSDEIGIVVSAKGLMSGRGYILADCSMRGSPLEWATTAIIAYDAFMADRIIGEANQGGNMVEHTIKTTATHLRRENKRESDYVPVTMVHATKGKVTRAEPVSGLYEQNRVVHVGTHTTLEDQMCLFTQDFNRKDMGYSPDRVDALVWGLTHLFLEQSDTGVLEFYQQLAMQKQADLVAATGPGTFVTLLVPRAGITHVGGKNGEQYMVQDGRVRVKPEDVPSLRGAGFKEIKE